MDLADIRAHFPHINIREKHATESTETPALKRVKTPPMDVGGLDDAEPAPAESSPFMKFECADDANIGVTLPERQWQVLRHEYPNSLLPNAFSLGDGLKTKWSPFDGVFNTKSWTVFAVSKALEILSTEGWNEPVAKCYELRDGRTHNPPRSRALDVFWSGDTYNIACVLTYFGLLDVPFLRSYEEMREGMRLGPGEDIRWRFADLTAYTIALEITEPNFEKHVSHITGLRSALAKQFGEAGFTFCRDRIRSRLSIPDITSAEWCIVGKLRALDDTLKSLLGGKSGRLILYPPHSASSEAKTMFEASLDDISTECLFVPGAKK